jgi:predicted nucleic acid-binding protein
MILVETSVWIEYFNASPSDEAAYLTLCIAEGQDLVIPGVVLAEILLGARSDADAARIRHVMSAFDLAPELERADYEHAAALYRACRARGLTPRSTIDCLIAQLCLKHGYELLARDRDFAAIAQVSALRLIVPSSSVKERAAQYRPVTHQRRGTTAGRAKLAKSAQTRLSPWEELRALGGGVRAMPDESVLRPGAPLTRRRSSAPRRSSRASAPHSRASRR